LQHVVTTTPALAELAARLATETRMGLTPSFF
jgi:hypothetical protein